MALPKTYIWQHKKWPELTFDHQAVGPAIAAARRLQGEIEGKARAIGLDRKGEVATEVLAQEVIATAAIEGEKLDPVAVRSSVMRHLGLADTGPHDRHVDGLVDVISDAGTAFQLPLDHDRLHRWQSALFPGGTSGITRIAVGRYRDHSDPMQIVSGLPGKEKVHYEAPPSGRVRAEMDRFLQWFSSTTPAALPEPQNMDGLARAAIAHVWFESIHPFEDGNGRIGRAIVDMALAQDQGSPLRLYSLSRQLLESRAAYYAALNHAQRGTGDVTGWIEWFARQIGAACVRSGEVIDRALEKSRFWASHATILKERQRKVLQRLLDDGDGGFLGGLNAEKYMKITAVSKATATRDLTDMLAENLLWTQGQGKSLRYFINVPGWSHGVQTEDQPHRRPQRPKG